ncbi:MAG: MBL fold metallo-hydrolase [Deltaproteobacteria bacterium]|nr:MBL fold metallo-hydrolase [Deltaproteobacteria bacterium]
MTGLPSWLTPIELPMPATMGRVNVYLIRGPRGAALVDTGMNDASSRKELVRALGALGLGLADLGTVVCTHHHADHAGLGLTLGKAGATMLMSAADAESIRLFFGDPGLDSMRATFYGRHEVPADFEERVAPMFPFFRSLSEDFAPSLTVEDGESLDLGGVPLEVVLTPGHTLGHLCLVSREAGLVLTGDHILAGEATHASMRPETEGTDPLGEFLASIRRVEALGLPLGLPGHGLPITDLPARARQLAAHHEKRLGDMLAALSDEPRTAFDLGERVFGVRKKPFLRWLSMSQALACLTHLAALGKAEEIQGGRGLVYRRTT